VPSPNDVLVRELKQDDEEVLAYWTPERRASAIPRALSRDIEHRPNREMPEADTEPGLQLHPEWPETDWLPQVGPTTNTVNNIQAAPYRSVGKVFFRWNGGDYSGSAWKLAGSGLATAGHNVYDRGAWSTSLVFYLRYIDGNSDGIYTSGALASLRGWVEQNNPDYDLAACRTRVAIDPGGTAPLPIAWNFPLSDLYTAIGYPGQAIPGYPFNGQRMWQSAGSPVFDDPNPVIAHINLTKGASGGPWLATIQGRTVVNGTHAHGTAEMSDSPYFGQGIKNLYDVAATW
jgi:V8-like Glu-specific endopeptidase